MPGHGENCPRGEGSSTRSAEPDRHRVENALDGLAAAPARALHSTPLILRKRPSSSPLRSCRRRRERGQDDAEIRQPAGVITNEPVSVQPIEVVVSEVLDGHREPIVPRVPHGIASCGRHRPEEHRADVRGQSTKWVTYEFVGSVPPTSAFVAVLSM